jgi:GAF domain-containing protein
MPNSDRLMDDLLGLLERVDLADGELESRIEDAVGGARDMLEANAAGLMLVGASGQLEVAGASSAAAAALEHAQLALSDGPGLESTKMRKVISVTDLQSDSRWPGLAARLKEHEVRAVLAAPIWLRGSPAGNLNMMCHTPREWSAGDMQALAAYAGVITAFLRIALDARHDSPITDALHLRLKSQ